MIRPINTEDWPSIFKIFQDIVTKGDALVYDENTDFSTFRQMWDHHTHDIFVFEIDGTLLGAYLLRPNQLGRGSHIANATYMVSMEAVGRGIGRKLCAHSITMAREKGYRAMQYNIVVSTNIRAVNLWKEHGFEIIGITKDGYFHKENGYVDTYIMYKDLIG